MKVSADGPKEIVGKAMQCAQKNSDDRICDGKLTIQAVQVFEDGFAVVRVDRVVVHVHAGEVACAEIIS